MSSLIGPFGKVEEFSLQIFFKFWDNIHDVTFFVDNK